MDLEIGNENQQVRESIWSVPKEMHTFYEWIFMYFVFVLLLVRWLTFDEMDDVERAWKTIRDAPGIVMMGVVYGMFLTGSLHNVLRNLRRMSTSLKCEREK